MFESLRCYACGGTFTREVTRGRKPQRCNTCAYYNSPIRYRSPATERKVSKAVVITDGGMRDAGIRDRNDCTVRAMTTATGAPYEEVHAFMARNGRRQGRGVVFQYVMAANPEAFGHRFTRVPLARSRGIRTAILRNPQLRTGTWILKMRSHVATLKDGRIMDSFDSSRKDVLYAWKVEPI